MKSKITTLGAKLGDFLNGSINIWNINIQSAPRGYSNPTYGNAQGSTIETPTAAVDAMGSIKGELSNQIIKEIISFAKLSKLYGI